MNKEKIRILISYIRPKANYYFNCPLCKSENIKFDGIEKYDDMICLEGVNFIFFCCNCKFSFKVSDYKIEKLISNIACSLDNKEVGK